MITSKIAINQTYSEMARVSKQANDDLSGKSTEKLSKTAAVDEADRDIKTELSHFAKNRIHQFNAEFGSVLKSVRIADHAMEKTQANIEQMESDIQSFMKMYPPYPPGSEERVELLKKYAGLRRDIEQLTMPRDGMGSDRGGLFDGHGLPELPSHAAESDFTSALDALVRIREVLVEERAALLKNTDHLIQSIG